MNSQIHVFQNVQRGKMMYRSILAVASVVYTIIYPIANTFLPLDKEIIFVSDLSDLSAVNNKTQYPIPNFVSLVSQHGYTAEEHTVKTSDGYLLKLHRISGSLSNPKVPGKPVAYIQHGLFQSSISFVLIGPDSDLAFQLVNAGYDVWLGNNRGNTYSANHVSKSRSRADFWDFSFHEIALYDLPASIDYILNETGQNSLTYYGFSIGTTVSYVLLSMMPEYNQKINLVYSLAPVAFWKHELRKAINVIDAASDFIKEYFVFFNLNAILPQTAVSAYIGERYCSEKNLIFQPICTMIVSILSVSDDFHTNKTALPTLLAHNPAGTSRMVLLHLHQNIEYGVLQPYDYGATKNLKKYGSVTPPIYNLTNIIAPVVLWYGNGDSIVNPKDVAELAKRLPNVLSSNAIAYNQFNHLDFIWATNAKSLLYDYIIRK